MGHDIQCHPCRVPHKKPPYAPRFVLQLIDDLTAIYNCLFICNVHIIHLNGNMRNRRTASSLGGKRQLWMAHLVGSKGKDPSLVHHNFKIKHLLVKGLDLFPINHRGLCGKIGHNTFYSHNRNTSIDEAGELWGSTTILNSNLPN